MPGKRPSTKRGVAPKPGQPFDPCALPDPIPQPAPYDPAPRPGPGPNVPVSADEYARLKELAKKSKPRQ